MSKVKIAAAQYTIEAFNSFADWDRKIQNWVEAAVRDGAKFLVFPEYGAMELTSLFSEEDRKNLQKQSFLLRQYMPDFEQTFINLAKKFSVYIVAPSVPYYLNDEQTTNRTYVFSPSGKINYQEKFYMTRFENEEWGVSSGINTIKIFATEHLSFAISTCFDVEFAFPGLAAAHAGAQVLFVPSCTETVKGANRVHIGARARALENQMYVVVSQTIGEASWSPAIDFNYGYAGFYSTPDVGMPDDGIIKVGEHNQSGWVYGELQISHIEKVRNHGAVFNYKVHADILNQQIRNYQDTVIAAQVIDFK